MSHQAAVLAPAAVVAVLLLSRITIGTHTPAADRLVMVGALFGGAAGAASLLSYALNQARRWTSIVTCPLPTAWALLLGGIAAGQLSVLFGYKDVPFRESVWLFSVPSAVYYIVVSLSWVLALTAGREFLSRVFGNRHWPFYAAAFASTALLLVLADAPALIFPATSPSRGPAGPPVIPRLSEWRPVGLDRPRWPRFPRPGTSARHRRSTDTVPSG